MAEKARPRYMDTPFADIFIKWMSRINTFIYRRSGGEGLGSTFQKIPVALLTTTGRKSGRAAGQSRCISCATATG